jgi:nucleoid DNA-binding protein
MLSKKDLVRQVAERTGLPQQALERSPDAILETYRDQLAAGETVALEHLGRFQVKRSGPDRP